MSNEVELSTYLFGLNNRIGSVELKLDILLSNFDFVLNEKDDSPQFKKVRSWLKKEVKARHRLTEHLIKRIGEVEILKTQISNLFDRLNKLEDLKGGK